MVRETSENFNFDLLPSPGEGKLVPMNKVNWEVGDGVKTMEEKSGGRQA